MNPRICVIIPAYNEALTIERCIKSVPAAGVPTKHVYVVDDGSTDATLTIVNTLCHGHVICHYSQKGKAAAIKSAVSCFDLFRRYDYIAILDADSQLQRGYFDAVRRNIKIHPYDALMCGTPQSRPHNWLTAFRAVEYAICLGLYREGQSLLGVVNCAPGCASTYRAADLEQLDIEGGTLVEDQDLTIQVQRQRKPVRYLPDAKVWTQDPRMLRDYVGQIMRWYKGTWQVVRKHRLGRQAQAIDAETVLLVGEGLAFSMLVLCLPALLWWQPFWTMVVVGLDQLLSLTFTLLVATNQRRKDVLLAFPTFIFLRLLNAAAFLTAFVLTRGKAVHPWYSPRRYV